MSSFNFSDMARLFEGMGIYEVLLPFLLVFTIVFAFLEKVHIFGEDNKKQNKKFHLVIALVMGLLLVQMESFVNMINLALPKISVVIIAILMFFIMISMFTGDDPSKFFTGDGKGALMGIFIACIAVVGWAFWSSYTGSNMPQWLGWVWDHIAVIIVIGVFAGILAYISGDEKKE